MTGEIEDEKFGLRFIAERCLRLVEMWLVEVGPLDIESVCTGPRELFACSRTGTE